MKKKSRMSLHILLRVILRIEREEDRDYSRYFAASFDIQAYKHTGIQAYRHTGIHPYCHTAISACLHSQRRLILCNNLCVIRQLIRSEEHTSELQSRVDLVCRLLLEKKKSSAVFHVSRWTVCRSSPIRRGAGEPTLATMQ